MKACAARLEQEVTVVVHLEQLENEWASTESASMALPLFEAEPFEDDIYSCWTW